MRPGLVVGEAEVAAASGCYELGGGGEQSQCELQPELVVRGIVQGKLRRPVAGAAVDSPLQAC
jgi:hypothetical protein